MGSIFSQFAKFAQLTWLLTLLYFSPLQFLLPIFEKLRQVLKALE
jgi:hypothetical protein